VVQMFERFNLTGRRALVTGSSRGIGAAIALGLAQAGADVAVHCADNVTAAKAVADQVRGLGRQACVLRCNLNDADAGSQIHHVATTTFGPIDILIHNASSQRRCEWADIAAEQFFQEVNVNMRSVLDLTQRFVPAMVERGWGRVLMVGSVQQARPHPQMAVYAATKAAIENLARNLARQLAAGGVTVNTLAPGVIDTDRNHDALSNPAIREKVLERIPAGRVGAPEDCVGAALLLCSPAGDYITGQNLYVDGGMSV